MSYLGFRVRVLTFLVSPLPPNNEDSNGMENQVSTVFHRTYAGTTSL